MGIFERYNQRIVEALRGYLSCCLNFIRCLRRVISEEVITGIVFKKVSVILSCRGQLRRMLLKVQEVTELFERAAASMTIHFQLNRRALSIFLKGGKSKLNVRGRLV